MGAVLAGSLAMRLLLGCGDAAPGSTFVSRGEDAGDETSSSTPPLGSSGGPDPAPTGPTTSVKAGPPVVAPVCDPSVARESCEPPESTFRLPATIVVARTSDAGCRQSMHAETRDGGAFGCIVGTATECWGPLELGTKHSFTLGHSTASGIVSTTFTLRFEGDGGVPDTVAIGGCFDSP